MAIADQKSAVADDAVTDCAEARYKDEQPLLEQRRNGALDVGRPGEVPEFLDDLRRIRGRHEKIRYQPEAPGDFAVERAQLGQGDGRKPAGIALTALRD